MGRVDEAMRRAGGTIASPPVPEVDVETLAAEPFPAEASLVEMPTLAPKAAVVDALAPATAGAPPSPGSDDLTAPVPPTSTFSFEALPAKLVGKVVTDAQMQPQSREQYRKLAAGLHSAQRANGIKVVMIASAVAGEGKTLTASNLALTLSESYRRSVLLIDGDLRRPSIHSVFQIEATPGLTDCLASVTDRRLPLHRVSDQLTVLSAGTATGDPMAGLTSDRMRQLIDEAREVFDWVIIDTPPVGLLTDANLLASMADAALLVVKADSTPYDLVQRAIDAMDKDRLLGVVLNQATHEAPGHGHSYYSAYYTPDAAKAIEK